MYGLLLTAALAVAHPLPACAKESHPFSVVGGDTALAIQQFGTQSGLQILASAEQLEGKQLHPVKGELSTDEAFKTLLAGTGLTQRYVGERIVALVKQDPDPAERMKVAQAENSRSEPATEPAGYQPGLLEEITVTARKRQERLQDVPASIVAASGEKIASMNIVSVTELDAIAPGLTFTSNPSRFGSGPAIAIRGISTQTQSSAVQDSVGVVVDGVPISRAKAGSFPDLTDTARVEVLRGPQGTLFGKNASAGVINITTQDPGSRFAADASADYATYDDKTFRAAVSGPLVQDVLLGRLSLYSKTRHGYVENVFNDSHWEDDNQRGGRAKLIFTPTSNDTFKLTGDYVDESNDAGANVIRGFTPVTPQYIRTALSGIVGRENDRINAHSLGQNRQQSGGVVLQWDHSFNENTLTALGGYRLFRQDFHAGTYTWLTPLDQGQQLGFTHLHQYTAEVRLASPSANRLNYVAGLFLLKDSIDASIQDPRTLTVQSGTFFGRHYASGVDTLNYAPFAEANFNVSDQFTVTGGLRWTHEKVDIGITGFPIAPGLARVGFPLGVTDDSATAEKVSWRLGGQWRVDPDLMFYVTAATGFKGPAFNANTSVLGNAQKTRPETATSFEIGLKSQYFDRRLTFNADVYRSTYKDFQAQGGLFIPGSPVSNIVLLNAGKLLSQGVEAELDASLTASTHVSMNATYIDATFKQFDNAQCYPGESLVVSSCAAHNVQNLSGTRLPNTPRFNYNLFATQAFNLPITTWQGFATLDYSYRSSIQWNNLNSPDGVESGYGLLGASLGMHSADDRISVKVYGKNLTDKFHTTGISVGTQITQFLPPDYRRVLGAEVAFKY